MPPKGYKAPPKLTADDYASSGELASYAANILAVVARKHPEMPMLLAAITLANQSAEALFEKRNAHADQRHSLPVVPPPPDADRPAGEEQS